MRKKSNFERFIFPAILSVGAFIAWGCRGGKAPGVGSVAEAFKHLTARASGGSHFYKPSGNLNAMAVGFAATATPSALQQSFQGKCNFTVDTRTIPADNIMPLVIDRGDEQNCNTWFTQPNPELGSLVIEDGTIGTLVVVADTTTARNLICKDLTNSGPATDGQFASVWFRPSDNQVLIFQGTSQVPTSCTLPVPAGDAVTRISAQFLKS